MKITQYMRQEKAITAADVKGIRERWLWGLRLLRDPEAISPDARGRGGSQLKKGVTDRLLKEAKARGYNLSEREIQRRLQAARAYKTDSQIASALTEFGTWFDLLNSGFPAYDAPDDEAPADHRTQDEKDHDRARALLDVIGEQGSLFPLAEFEPAETTLKELQDYADQQAELTARFAAHDKKRRDYLDALIQAADGDLDATWQEAHDRLPDDDALDEADEEAA